MGPMSTVKKISLVFLAILLVLDSFLLVYITTIKVTVLNPTFIEQELEELGLYAIAREQLINESMEDPWRAEIFRRSITESWMKEQVHVLIPNLLAYINSETDTLNLNISTVEVKNNLKDSVRDIVLESPPPEISNYTREEIEMFLAEFDSYVDSSIPDEAEITEFIGDEQLGPLEELRTIVSYLNLGYYIAIAMAVIFVLLVALICRGAKLFFMALGVSLIVGGILSYGMSFVIVSTLLNFIPIADLPPLISQTMMVEVIEDIITPARTYAIILSGLGLGLMVVSILLRRRAAPEIPSPLPGFPG